MKKTGILCWAGLALTVLVGCKSTKPKHAAVPHNATVVTRALSPDLLQPPKDLFVLGPGDQLEIERIGTTTARSTNTVGLDGKIYYSFLPGVDVDGMTLNQAKTAVEQELSKYESQPQMVVTLRAVASKSVWVLGRLNKPGVYPIAGSMTLLEALSLAGGTAKSASQITTQELADLRHSFVMRDGTMLPVNFVRLLQEGDMSQNIYLKPGDFVYVPSSLSQEIYVLGAVLAPRTVPYSDQMTVVSAVAGANGTIKNAYLSHVAIVRGSLSEPQIIEVDYNDIIHGKAQNVLLEPGDIVYVPLAPYRFITDYADLIVTTFVRTWSANEGIRAVSGSSGTVGVTVPIGVR
ncbi:MAG: polysaccharide export protein Wza [Pedosphaera sp.]|nr:polysaccharide export protein Wza [Pedosphaera sp.]